MKPDTYSTTAATLARFAEDGCLDPADLLSLISLDWRGTAFKVGQRLNFPASVSILRSGWAARLRILPSGQRQMLALVLPGDVCSFDLLAGDMREPSYVIDNVVALTPLTVVHIPLAQFAKAAEARPVLMRALLASLLIVRAMADEHIVSLGSRTARERMAHFLCEVSCRLGKMGLARGRRFRLPMTQPEIGDYLSLSSVHVNRTLQSLRADGLVSTARGELDILQADRLADIAGFNHDYLSLNLPIADEDPAMCSEDELVLPTRLHGVARISRTGTGH